MANHPERDLDQIDNGQIISKLEVPADIDINQEISDDEKINAYATTAGINFKISWLISYFKLVEGDRYIPFPKDSTITIYYEGVSWYKGGGNDSGVNPRVAYLAKENGEWVNHWVEFIDEIKNPKPPKGKNPGSIEIDLEDIPDPLIGGC